MNIHVIVKDETGQCRNFMNDKRRGQIDIW